MSSGLNWNEGPDEADGSGKPGPEQTPPPESEPPEPNPLLPVPAFRPEAEAPKAERVDSGLPMGHKRVVQEKEAWDAIQAMMEKKRRGDRVFLIAGGTASGKTAFSWRLKDLVTYERHRKFQRTADRTNRGHVNFVDVPGYPVFFDIAGEDFSDLATKEEFQTNFSFLKNFLWRALRVVDGIVLLIDFPMIWYDYNQRVACEANKRPIPQDLENRDRWTLADEALRQEGRLHDAFQRLIQMALLSRDWARLAKKNSRDFGGDGDLPSYQEIKDKAHYARRLDIPIFMALAKADAYRSIDWPGGMIPPCAGGEQAIRVDPTQVWPRSVVRARMSDFYQFLGRRVRNYAFGFVQSFDARGLVKTEEIDVMIERESIDSLLGASDVMSFLDGHPWFLGPPFLSITWLHRLYESWASFMGRGRNGDPWRKA